MSSVVATAIFVPIEGRKEQLIEALQESVPAVHDETGCELYAIHDAADGTVVLIEKWASPAELDNHNKGAAGAALVGRIRSLLAAPIVVNRMTSVPAGAHQGTL